MNIRKQISRWLLKPETDRLRALTQEMVNDWRMIPYLSARSPEALIEQLAEVDSQLVAFLARQIRDYGLGMDTSETFRAQIVKECRSLYVFDPLTQFAIELWTDYAFGSKPNLTAEDTAAQETWDEFWNAERNAPVLGDRKLHKNSETLLTDGELFFAVFASRLDGLSTVRLIPTDQIKEILTDPGDSSVALYYRRDYTTPDGAFETVYYPCWSASPEQLALANLPSGAKLADQVNPQTDVVVMQAAFREIGGRGWPLATASVDWSKEYRQFLQNRAAVSRAAATWVEKIKAKTGQRGLDAMKSRLGSAIGATDMYDSNPPPVAGSTWLENEAATREWMNRPTNSADAEKDGMALLTQAGLGYKLYPHYLGRGDTYRLATSTAMEGPTLKSFNRYQSFWSSVWRDLFKIVAMMAERYGGKAFSSLEAKVSTDRVITVAQEEVTQAIGAVNDMLDRGLVEPEPAQEIIKALVRVMLESMGMQGVDEMLKKIKKPVEKASPEPAPPPDPNAVPPEGDETEAGESARPFVESAPGTEQYRTNLRGAVYGLWSGKISRDEFTEQMQIAIDAGLRNAWLDGIKALGLTADDLTQEELIALADAVLSEYGYIAGFADAIEAGSKANGGKLADLQNRLSLWVNRYNQVRSRALLMAGENPPLQWNEGDTEEKCNDCLYANGRVYRASVWKKWGWEPQSQDLECGGWQCQCSLDPVPKGTRITRGHPRRPHGHGG